MALKKTLTEYKVTQFHLLRHEILSVGLCTVHLDERIGTKCLQSRLQIENGNLMNVQ